MSKADGGPLNRSGGRSGATAPARKSSGGASHFGLPLGGRSCRDPAPSAVEPVETPRRRRSSLSRPRAFGGRACRDPAPSVVETARGVARTYVHRRVRARRGGSTAERRGWREILGKI